MGSNMAEAHPVGFRWPMKAKEKGATLIHVDPRFTRTSALCDVYVGIRAGSDIAFLGGLINYVLTNDRWFKEYVLAYTNASTIIQEGFRDTEDLAGLFSGYHGDGATGKYDAEEGHWGYEGAACGGGQDRRRIAEGGARHSRPRPHGRRHVPHSARGHDAAPAASRRATRPCSTRAASSRSSSATSPATRRRSSSQVCGCTPEELVRVAELLCANSGRERTSAIVYALGWTQHTTGVQMIRTAGILQLLLGNMGRPGGGIMAMRGHSTIQGSTDVATLVRPAARLPAAAGRRRAARDAGFLRRARGPADRLLGQLPQVHRQPAQGVVRRRGHAGERLRLLVAAAGGRRLFAAGLLRPHGQGRGQGLLPVRPEPRRRRAERRPAPGRPAQPRLAGRPRLVRDRERRLLEERPERAAARRDQDRGLLHPRGGRAGEGGQPDQHAAAAPVARQGRRPARRLPLRRLVRLQPRQAPQGALRRLDRAQGPAAAAPHLGLRLRRAAAPARRHGQPDRGRAGPGKGPAGDQRLQSSDESDPTHRPAAACWPASPS